MDKSFFLSGLPIEDLLLEIDKLIVKRLEEARQKDILEKMLSVKEVCSLLKITKPTLTSWVNDGKIKEKRIGTRILYKYSDVMLAMRTVEKYKPLKITNL